MADEVDPFRDRLEMLENSTTALRLAPHFQDWRGGPPDPSTVQALVGAARRIGANPAHLLAVVQHESRFNPKAQYGDIQGRRPFDPTKPQGLLQFTAATAKGLGTTPQAIRSMGVEQQVKLVEKFLRARARERLDGGDLDTLGKVAMATFYPAYMGKNVDTVFPARVQESNPGIRTPADYLALLGDAKELTQLGEESEMGSLGEIQNPPPPTGSLPEILALLHQRINITAQQRGHLETQARSIQIILREFASAGVPLAITLAALANAFVESKLDPNAMAYYPVWSFTNASAAVAAPPKAARPGGVVEDSRGLFQLNIKGAGKGMSAAARHDPVQNTRRILEEYKSSWGDGLRAAHAAGAPVDRLAYLWAKDIERPAAVDAQRVTTQNAFLGPFVGIANLGQGAKRVTQYVEQGVKQGVEHAREAAGKAAGGLGAMAVLMFGGALLLWFTQRRR